MLLELLALVLAGIHFGVPLIYYLYLKSRCLNRSWNIKIEEIYKPKVAIVLPTYNEAEFIWQRLDNIYAQDYPKELMEVVVVDSASEDRTADLVKKWIFEHNNIDLKLVEEPVRRGKLSAVLEALKYVSSESSIVIFTDADALWESDALRKATMYFADPTIGAVTSSIVYSNDKTFENTYRDYYNIVRIAESKIHSTPVHNGPFLAIKTELLRKFGLPTFPGSDDSSFGSFVAFLGFRAIQVDDVIVKEPVRGSQFRRKMRRAQHLLLSFLKTKSYAKKLGVYRRVKSFEKIWKVEWWLHVVNPWFLTASAILLVMSTFYASFMATTLLGVGIMFLVLKAYRMWVLQQLYLVIAAMRNLWTREIAWSK
jgi:biofilm PGA synthesis N-glycosyltransferase PgaC